jgi:HK97 family phage portal protein
MFLAADLGDTGGRGPFDDFWYSPITGATAAGMRVNDESAMRLAFAYGCISVISQDIAKVPLCLYRRLDNETSRARVYDHAAIKVLQAPGGRMTNVDWKERLQAHQLTRGNGYCEKQYDFRGRWKALPPWKPDNVRTELLSDGRVRYLVRDPLKGIERVYLEDEVLHLRGLSIDGPLGLSPIDQARETLGEGLAAQAYGATFFANDARPSIAIQRKDGFKDESLREEWIKRFKKMFGGKNRFTPMLLEYGMEVKEIPTLSHVDLQFLELRKFKGYEICAIYRVPPHKVAILERSTNNNIEHQGIEYVTDCLLTWCRRWEERLAADLLGDDERDEFYFEFNLDVLMRGDMKTRYDAYVAAGGGPFLKRNEIRARENLEPVPEFDKPLDPMNMQGPGALKTNKPNPQPTQPSDDEEADARTRELELQARRRVLNRETKAVGREWERAAGNAATFAQAVTSFYAWHADFVAQALVLPKARAEAYCMAQVADVERAIAASSVNQMLAAWEADAQAMQFTPIPPATKSE